jgi:hypothetical protein
MSKKKQVKVSFIFTKKVVDWKKSKSKSRPLSMSTRHKFLISQATTLHRGYKSLSTVQSQPTLAYTHIKCILLLTSILTFFTSRSYTANTCCRQFQPCNNDIKYVGRCACKFHHPTPKHTSLTIFVLLFCVNGFNPTTSLHQTKSHTMQQYFSQN